MNYTIDVRIDFRGHRELQITVTIPDEFAAQAQARGMSIEVYVQSFGKGQPQIASSPRRKMPEEIEAFFEAMAEGSERLPALPTEDFTRESFYPDRV